MEGWLWGNLGCDVLAAIALLLRLRNDIDNRSIGRPLLQRLPGETS